MYSVEESPGTTAEQGALQMFTLIADERRAAQSTIDWKS